jgi:hypothetical protein
MCLFCLYRPPVGSPIQLVSVDASYCCPLSLYIKPCCTVTSSGTYSKNLLLLYSVFLTKKLFWPVFFGSVSNFYLISRYQLTSSLQLYSHKPKYFEMCISTYMTSPYVASSGPLALIVTLRNITLFSYLNLWSSWAHFVCYVPYSPFCTYECNKNVNHEALTRL